VLACHFLQLCIQLSVTLRLQHESLVLGQEDVIRVLVKSLACAVYLTGFLVVFGDVGVLVQTEHLGAGQHRQAADVRQIGLVRTHWRRVVETARRKPTHGRTTSTCRSRSRHLDVTGQDRLGSRDLVLQDHGFPDCPILSHPDDSIGCHSHIASVQSKL